MNIYTTEKMIQVMKWSYAGYSNREICELVSIHPKNKFTSHLELEERHQRQFNEIGETNIIVKIKTEPTACVRQIHKTTICKSLAYYI